MAQQQENEAKEELEKAQKNQETVRESKAEIGRVYHPFHPESGKLQDSQEVEKLLLSCFDKIYEAIGSLSERCKKRVEKAQRVVPNMVATIAFFFSIVEQHLESLGACSDEKKIMLEYLIPGYYLQLVAQKEKDIDRKATILTKSEELLSIKTQRDGPLCEKSPEEIEKLLKAAIDCANIFQRSSSCVEGRNAQLSLRHHGLHRLSDNHLQAQTVIHNYYVKRADSTTAAERFFEAKHNDVFDWLLNRMDYPARPRKSLAKAA